MILEFYSELCAAFNAFSGVLFSFFSVFLCVFAAFLCEINFV